MKHKIENGEDIIDILSDGFVTCLKIKKPIAVDWWDCRGSAGKYFSFTSDFEPLTKQFNETLINGSESEILEVVKDFLKLFRSGEYSILITKKEQDEVEVHFNYTQIEKTKNFNYWYYNPWGEGFMFTQDISIIDLKRVSEYESFIKNGERPKAVLFQASFNDDGTYDDGSKWSRSVDSPKFILDGHHKILAYQNLKIEPEFVLITRETIGKEDFNQNGKNLFLTYEYFLQNSAKEHIISHNPEILNYDTNESRNYNFHFDNYLKKANRLETKILELFKSTFQSGEKSKINWLIEKLEILENKINEKAKFYLNHLEFTEEHKYGIWNQIDINSKDDFDNWCLKMFGKKIVEIKNNIS